MAERLTSKDETLIRGYGVHIQRYEFAKPFCQGKHVLDAGCGVGHGAMHLARTGAASVTGLDLSPAAVDEATQAFVRPNLRFTIGDVEKLDTCKTLPPKIDVVVNCENLEHLRHPSEFLRHARALLSRPDGILVTSTPNGDITQFNADGKPLNPFHFKEYTPNEFLALLTPFFAEVSLYGQWQTYDGRLRVLRDRQIHEQLCEAYYNPAARFGRVIKRLIGKSIAPSPPYSGDGDEFTQDNCIAPLDNPPFNWAPHVLLAVCKG